ncbi:MAG: ABC transporter permease [Anaerolineae bacterium]|nr:ABC transporter permease [Anaerolineae bacterium]MCB9105811.1 ABC transporter permease [Anaerolineales bacterium]
MNTGYILQRLFSTLIVIFGITFVVFMIIQLVPGDPARVVLGVAASEENVAALRERLGLNRPIWEQYGSWLSELAQGDLGNSLVTGQPVLEQILQRLPATLVLATAGLIVGLLIGLPAGIMSALKPHSPLDTTTSILSQIGVSIPDFWLGILLVLLFSLTLGWLPSQGYTPFSQDPVDWFRHLILPALTVGIISGSIQTRFNRSAMLEVLHQDYIRTARAKGLREALVVNRHALRNALIPIITILGLQLTALLSAVVVVEVVFSWPGLGRLTLEAVLDRDYPLLQGAVFTIATLLALVNLGTDLLYAFIDPRIEYA